MRKAFTVVEVLVVVVVIGILAGLVVISYDKVVENAAKSSAKANSSSVASEISSKLLDQGEYPQNLDSIDSLDNDTYTYTYVSGGDKFCVSTTHKEESSVSFHTTETGITSDGVCPTNYISIAAPSAAPGISAGEQGSTQHQGKTVFKWRQFTIENDSNISCAAPSTKEYSWVGASSSGVLTGRAERTGSPQSDPPSYDVYARVRCTLDGESSTWRNSNIINF